MDMAGEYRIKKISAADQVYDQLRQLITNGTWKAGEKIPTEGQLAEAAGHRAAGHPGGQRHLCKGI